MRRWSSCCGSRSRRVASSHGPLASSGHESRRQKRAGSGVTGDRMKLQVQQQSLRVRVTEAELQQLLSGSPLRLEVVFDGNTLLSVEVAAGTDTSFAAGATWRLTLSEEALRTYAGTLPRRDAFVAAMNRSGGEPLRLEFEVDVRDSVKVRGPRKGGAG